LAHAPVVRDEEEETLPQKSGGARWDDSRYAGSGIVALLPGQRWIQSMAPTRVVLPVDESVFGPNERTEPLGFDEHDRWTPVEGHRAK
jgi:hypothetical protein